MTVFLIQFFLLFLQIDPKVAFPRRAHPKVSEKYMIVYTYFKAKIHFEAENIISSKKKKNDNYAVNVLIFVW